MDAFTLTMAATLAVAGWFLTRDYARFLRGTYAMRGRVTSIQQVFVSRMDTHEKGDIASQIVKNGFYPVIEYPAPGGAISFTAIDVNASGRFHVGDEVCLKVSKTRRKETRICGTFSVLMLMLGLLVLGLLGLAIFSGFNASASQIVLASIVLSVCLSISVLYIRDQDENCKHDLTRTESGYTQLCLFEPTAFSKWKSALRDPVQRNKIRSSQVCGATCMGSAVVMMLVALQPLLHISI